MAKGKKGRDTGDGRGGQKDSKVQLIGEHVWRRERRDDTRIRRMKGGGTMR